MNKINITKIFSFLIRLFCISLAGPGMLHAQMPGQHLELYVGQTEILTQKGVTRVSVGDGKLVDVKSLNDIGQVLLIGKSEGTTDLRIWTQNGLQSHYLLKVFRQPTEQILRQVREHLADIEGVSARMVADRIVLEGRSLRETDMERVKAVADQFDQVVSYVSSGGVTLHGMIYLDVKVLEVKKSELRKIGVDWANIANGPQYSTLNDYTTNSFYRPNSAPGAAGGTLPTDVGSHNPYFGISTSITSVINIMAQNGYARLLAEPKLTCRSGGKAEFLAGGEVPLPIRNQDGSITVTFKEYGIILKMEPISDPEGFIATRVNVEVSTIDDSVRVLDIPGFLTRKTETDMNVRRGQTMVISGLLNQESTKDVDKVPGLGNIPVLGELFKSRSFRNSETELVILVTPDLIDPDHKINQNYLGRVSELEEEAKSSLKYNIMD